MITKLPLPEKKKKTVDCVPGHDFTVIDKDINGNVVMEVNTWCDETQDHQSVTLLKPLSSKKIMTSSVYSEKPFVDLLVEVQNVATFWSLTIGLQVALTFRTTKILEPHLESKIGLGQSLIGVLSERDNCHPTTGSSF